jgi:hypothetical protein
MQCAYLNQDLVRSSTAADKGRLFREPYGPSLRCSQRGQAPSHWSHMKTTLSVQMSIVSKELRHSEYTYFETHFHVCFVSRLWTNLTRGIKKSQVPAIWRFSMRHFMKQSWTDCIKCYHSTQVLPAYGGLNRGFHAIGSTPVNSHSVILRNHLALTQCIKDFRIPTHSSFMPLYFQSQATIWFRLGCFVESWTFDRWICKAENGLSQSLAFIYPTETVSCD